MIQRVVNLMWACGVAVGAAMSQSAQALQQSPPPAEQSKKEQAKQEKPKDDKPQPSKDEQSLDELLGLEKDKKDGGDAKPIDQKEVTKPPQDAALERALKPGEERDDFKQAVDMMKETSDRMVSSKDVGLDTQRLQEQVLRKLDKMIDDAQKNQGKKSKQKPQDQQQDQQQQQQQQSSQSKPSSQTGKEAKGGDVAQQNAQANTVAGGAEAAWGGLPPHVRDALMQGLSDRFSTSYQRLTEEYYKRLASQERVQGGSGKPEKP